MANLYDLTNDMKAVEAAVEALMEQTGGEITEEGDALLSALDAIKEERTAKFDGIARIMKNFGSDVDGLKAEEKRIAMRRKALESTIERIRAYVTAMIGDDEKINTGLFKFAPSWSHPTIVLLEEKLPEEAFVIERKVSLTNVKKLIEDGVIPADIAYLGDKKGIRIS